MEIGVRILLAFLVPQVRQERGVCVCERERERQTEREIYFHRNAERSGSWFFLFFFFSESIRQVSLGLLLAQMAGLSSLFRVSRRRHTESPAPPHPRASLSPRCFCPSPAAPLSPPAHGWPRFVAPREKSVCVRERERSVW